MLERGVEVDRTTIYRWVQHYSLELTDGVVPICIPLMIPGESMRRTSWSREPGNTWIALWILKATPSTSCSLPNAMPKLQNGSFVRHSTLLTLRSLG